MLDPKVISFLSTLSKGKEVSEFLNSPVVQSLVEEMRSKLASSAGVTDKQTESEVTITQLIEDYKKLIYKSFKHKRNGTTYVLLGITNMLTTDHIKFPVLATYVDSSGVKWTRTLLSFNSNFTLI